MSAAKEDDLPRKDAGPAPRDRLFDKPFAKTAALLCFMGAVIGLGSGLVTARITPAVSLFQYSFPYTLRGFLVAQSVLILNHLLLLGGILAFARSGIASAGRQGRTGLRIAITGMALLTLCEVRAMTLVSESYPSFNTTLLDGFFALAMVLVGLGLALAGTATIRTHALARRGSLSSG